MMPAFENGQQHDEVAFCHCFGCRHSTGQLYASYYKLHEMEPRTNLLDAVFTKYTSATKAETGSVDLYFCTKCGCHVFRSTATENSTVVEVATGTVIAEDSAIADSTENHSLGPHVNIPFTTDGGVSIWMPFVHEDPSQSPSPHALENITSRIMVQKAAEGTTTAACLCGRLQFRITHPSEDSITPHSGYPDMIIPFYTKSPEIKNLNDEKWWLRQNNTKYMAGLCACKSCRLASGFELQSWAFIPRLNIEYWVSSLESSTAAAPTWCTLDFDALHEAGLLRSYNSSDGVLREFCPTCGATAFWHDMWRPGLIDVSVGLLNSPDGVRAESILEWWTSRISFAEDTTLDRSGSWAKTANYLVQEVERCMETCNANG